MLRRRRHHFLLLLLLLLLLRASPPQQLRPPRASQRRLGRSSLLPRRKRLLVRPPACDLLSRAKSRGKKSEEKFRVSELESERQIKATPFRESVEMLASTSRPMPAEAAMRRSGRAVAVGDSPMRRSTAVRSSNPQQQRRLESPLPVGALRFASATTTTTAARAAAAPSSDALPPPPAGGTRKRVVILGGTGRVGASTALQLVKGPGGDQLDLVLVGQLVVGACPPEARLLLLRTVLHRE